MKKVLVPILSILVVALACGGTVWADTTVLDPLHGQCNGTGTGTCSDNGTNTPLGNSTGFGFTISPGPQTGDLQIVLLVPDNELPAGPFTINFSNNTLAGTATLFSATNWTSGFLDAYLGIPGGASPANPIGAYLPTTQSLDPGAMGYGVFVADIGTQTLPANASGATDTFNIPSGFGADIGGYIVGFCLSCVNPTGATNNVATANSGALLVNGNTPVPEPGSLMMLGIGLLGLTLLTGRRVLTA